MPEADTVPRADYLALHRAWFRAELEANRERVARAELEARLRGEDPLAAGRAVDEAFQQKHGLEF